MLNPHHYVAATLAVALSASIPTLGHAAVADPLFANDGSWSIDVNPASDESGFDITGLNSWYQSDRGSDSMYQQWFWFRTDTTGPEQRLESLTYNGGSNPSANSINMNFGDAANGDAIEVDLNYTLTANSSTSSTIAETIDITNTSGADLYLSFFAYTDLDLNSGPVDRTAFFQGPQQIVQDDFDGTTTTVFGTIGGANGFRSEISTYPDQLDRLDDGGTTDLSGTDISGGGPADFTHAFQWEYNSIAAGATVTIDITKDVILGSGSSPFDPVLPTDPVAGDPFEFPDLNVNPADTWWLDPEVAIGYDYSSSTVNFASVTVPGSGVGDADIGDGLFDIYLFDTGTGDFTNLVATLDGSDPGNNTFTFTSSGVDQFSIRGIEVSAGLDPDDVTAFSAGVTFVGNGATTVQMDALRVNLPSAPIPGTVLLMAAGLIGIGRMARMRGTPKAAPIAA